jgi:hypothetical protein
MHLLESAIFNELNASQAQISKRTCGEQFPINQKWAKPAGNW